jgi:integrase/recombinase XerD
MQKGIELTLEELKLCFLTYISDKGLGTRRITEYNMIIDMFYEYLSGRNILSLTRITKKLLIELQYYLYNRKYLSDDVVKRKIQALGVYFRYLYHNNLIYTNPFINLKLIPAPKPENLREMRRYYNFPELLSRWINSLKRDGLCYTTIRDKLRDMKIFIKFIEQRGLTSIYKVTEEILRDFLEYLPMQGYSNINCSLIAMRLGQFYKFLRRQLLTNRYPIGFLNLSEYRRYLEGRFKNMPTLEPVSVIKTPWDEQINGFCKYFLSLGRNKSTLKGYILALKVFKQYMDSKGIANIKRITRADIIEFQQYLGGCIDSKGKPYTPVLIHSRMIAIRSFFRYLLMSGQLNCDPAGNIELIKREDGLPHTCMTQKEAERLLSLPDINTTIGIRDRAIMEVLYSTGMRSCELINLSLDSIDFTNGLIRIGHPKGGKRYERIIAIGRIACELTKKYINEVRPTLINNGNGGNYLFLSIKGNKLARNIVNDIIKKYLFRSGLRKRISSHSWRVTCATLMLENNADIRYIQEQLGHKSIKTTQVYTRLIPKDLKRIHSQCHPREKDLA